MNFPKPQDLMRTAVNSLIQRGIWMLPKNVVILLIIVVVLISLFLSK